MNIRLIAILVILLAASLACQVTPFGDNPGDSGTVLFQDDFSNPDSGWDRVSTDKGETDYLDGAYRISVKQANTDLWAKPGLDFSDVHIEVDATKAGGDDNNDFGVVCRMQDANHFYFLIISSDGYYGIGKYAGNQQKLLGTNAMQPTDIVKQGATTNHIRADCIGNTISLYANGQKLQEVQDADYTTGDAGLIAGSFDTPGTEIHFDNFSVLKP